MSKRGKALGALGLVAVGVGLAVAVGFLHGQTLDRAAAWATVAGFFVSTVLSLAGVVVGWLAWRDGHRDVVPVTGSIRQRNRNGYNLASTGRMTGPAAATTSDPGAASGAGRTGEIDQENVGGINVANTGLVEGLEPPGPIVGPPGTRD